MIKSALVEVSNDLNFWSLQSLVDSKVLDKFGTKNIAKNVKIRYNIGFDIRDLKVNLELLNQIHQIHQDLADGKEVEFLRIRENGEFNFKLVRDIHELYYNGHLYLPKFCQVFGTALYNIKYAFEKMNLGMLNLKQTHEIYRDYIQSSKRKTNLERYGCEAPSQSPEIQEKMVQTNLKRYGVKNANQSSTIREKSKKTNLKRYGVENPFQSPEIQEKMRQSNIEKFGFGYASQSPVIQMKIKKTNLKRYGCENPMSSRVIQEKVKRTNLKRYGVENPSQSPMIQEKVKRTNLERLGVEYASQSPEIQEKVKRTNLERLGVEYASQSPEIQEKIKQTNLERYGFENPSQSPMIQEKIKQTNLERYGFENPMSSPEIQEKVKSTRKSNNRRYAKLLDLVENEPDKAPGFVIGNYPYNHSTILKRYGLYQENLSTPEIAIREILEKHKIEYQFRYRPKFMDGKELDFFIPNRRAPNNPDTGKPGNELAIEVNGLYWHSYPKKDKYYHQDKHLRCRSEGIQLLSFTEDQILEKSEIIESMILHKLGLTPYRVYAKDCTIRELRTKEAKEFFESNHLHGWAVGQICYALEYEGKIVHAMSFGNNRFKRSNHPELIRSASLRFHSVAGGFQRLLKYYKARNNIDLVESYVDFNISNGQSYELASKDLGDLGNSSVRETVRDNLTEPDLWFVYRGKRYRRQMFMKHNLHKIFKDFPKRGEEGYEDITCGEYLKDRGVLEYYGAGNLKYLI